MCVFSLHPVKTIAAGEGGVVTTNDAELDKQLRRFRSHGMIREPLEFQNPDLALSEDGRPNPWYYEMHVPGFNYRMNDILCALAGSQLKKLDGFLARRCALVERYDRLLAPLAPLVQPVSRVSGRTGWHIYVVQIDFAAVGISRIQVMERLRAQGIGTQVHYLPVHMQPYYQQRYGQLDLCGSNVYYAKALTLPLFPAMRDMDAERVVVALQAALAP